MAKQTDDKEKNKRQLVMLNNLFRKTSDQISSNVYGTDNSARDDIVRLNRDIDSIISSELANTKSITSDDMSTFLVKLFNDYDRDMSGSSKFDTKSLDDIFTNQAGGLFQFFQERYQNQNLLYEDLKIISDQLFEMSEAIMTMRDSIVTSDDISKTISRTLRFIHADHSDEQSDSISSYIRTIEEVERRLKLQTKLKNQVIPNVLTYGEYYIYVCPYSKLFQDQYDKKKDDPTLNNVSTKVSESVDDEFIKCVYESVNGVLEGIKTDSNDKNKYAIDTKGSALNNIVKSCIDNIKITNNVVSIPLLEGTDLTELVDNDAFVKTKKKAMKNISVSTDGTVDTNKRKNKNESFADQTGCYIKYIDPRRMIPVTILDTVIGYYYIHTTDLQVNKSPFSNTIRVSNLNGLPNQNIEDVERMFLSNVTDRIVKAFDKPFLENNAKFKDLILNSLLYNDMYKKELNFQFIPADYVVEFKINEDENGHGQSMLNKALFYAKLYLSLLIFKMISIITKSNDTRIYYIKNSGIDQNITNKVQEVARSIKGRQINFMDLLNYNSIISKIGAYKDIFIPVGRSGDRGIDFDTLAGQDVPLNTDLMEMLRTNMINGTGVPSVIMNYINEADYAKTLTMAHSKFVGRTITYQLDLNGPTTEFYKKIIKFSNLSIPEELLDEFEFTYNAPKTLNNMNMADMISNTDVVINAAIKAATGEMADQTDRSNRIKDKMYDLLFRKYMPMLDWSDIDYAYNQAELAIVAEDEEKKANTPTDNSAQDSY